MTEIGDVVDQDVRIRVAQPNEFNDLLDLDAAVFEHLAYQPFALRQLLDLHREWWMVAVHLDGLCGYSLGVPTFDRARGWLLGLGVRERFRHRGYGTSLTRASMRRLADIGVRELYLTVEPDNRGAIRLYRGLGFDVEGMGKDYLGPGEDRLIMVADLRDRPGP
jgi:ribosomal-protein-alanine N-acetyltransferase